MKCIFVLLQFRLLYVAQQTVILGVIGLANWVLIAGVQTFVANCPPLTYSLVIFGKLNCVSVFTF